MQYLRSESVVTAIMGKTYLNRKEQDILYRLGAVASTLEDIDAELSAAGKRTKEIRTALTNVNKQIHSMCKDLPPRKFAQYMERIKHRVIAIMDK